MSDINKKKAEMLQNTIKKPCKDCEAKAANSNPIMQMILSKLGQQSPCGCSNSAAPSVNPEPMASRTVLMVIKKPEQDKVDDKSGKKILEKQVEEATHRTDKFVQRCVGAITGGDPKNQQDLHSAFAKCKATENKHEGKNLNKAAVKREGFKSRKAQFVQALEKIKKHGKNK